MEVLFLVLNCLIKPSHGHKTWKKFHLNDVLLPFPQKHFMKTVNLSALKTFRYLDAVDIIPMQEIRCVEKMPSI